MPKTIQLVVAAWLFACAPMVSASVLTIDTSAAWRSFDSEVAGWTLPGFDDSAWRDAYEDYATHPDASFAELTTAKTIWDWPNPDSAPTGTGGPLEAFFRYSVTLDGPVSGAQFSYAVDDAMKLYVNGTEAYAHVGAGNTNVPGYRAIDSSLFVSGENILAVRAWDGSSFRVYDRGGEALTASFRIETVPAPATLWLMAVGLAGAILRVRAPAVRPCRAANAAL